MFRVLTNIGDLLRWLLSSLVGLMLFAIVILVCIQVFSRYFIGAPTPGMAEMSRLLFIWLTFVGSALLISRRELIVIDFLHDRLNARYIQRLGLLIDAVTAVFLVVLSFYARHLMDVVGHKIAPATGLPFSLFYGSLLAFSGFGLFFIIERLFAPRALIAKEADGARIPAEGSRP